MLIIAAFIAMVAAVAVPVRSTANRDLKRIRRHADETLAAASERGFESDAEPQAPPKPLSDFEMFRQGDDRPDQRISQRF